MSKVFFIIYRLNGGRYAIRAWRRVWFFTWPIGWEYWACPCGDRLKYNFSAKEPQVFYSTEYEAADKIYGTLIPSFSPMPPMPVKSIGLDDWEEDIV